MSEGTQRVIAMVLVALIGAVVVAWMLYSEKQRDDEYRKARARFEAQRERVEKRMRESREREE